MRRVGRIGALLAAIVRTRLELAALEIEEHSRRLLDELLLSLAALFLFAVSVVLLAFFVIVLFWDTYRIAAVLGMAGLFALGGIGIVFKLRSDVGKRPKLLAHTVAELGKDIDFAKTAGQGHEN